MVLYCDSDYTNSAVGIFACVGIAIKTEYVKV